MKTRLFLIIQLLFYISTNVLSQKTSVKNIDNRVDSLLKLMTLEEKIGQLNQVSLGQYTGPGGKKIDLVKDITSGKISSILNIYGADTTRKYQKLAVENSRLKIPLLFAYDVIHGAKTIFPIPLAEASSWDMEAIEKSSRVAGTESAALGLHWTFAPMVDICRDPRWGRIMEGSGEDTYLGEEIAKARVKGLQGNDLNENNTILACAKHFAGYGAVESGREYNTTTISIRNLREVYLPPFKAAIDAGVGTVMNAFNDIDGIPASGSKFLVTDVLKKEWDFSGFTISDWNSIGEMVKWGTAKNGYEAAEQAINAGSDMDMMSFTYVEEIGKLIKDGKVTEAQINNSVKRILKMKFALGLFDNPFKYCDSKREKEVLFSEPHKEAARDVARKSIVLLKNEKNILPLKKDLKTILVVGSVANQKWDMSSTWAGMADVKNNVSILEGIQSKVSPSTKILYTMGADPKDENILKLDSALLLAKKAEVIIMTLGERGWWVGENNSFANIHVRKNEITLMNELLKTGKPVVVLLTNGRPIIMNEVAEKAPCILETWWLGSQAGHAIADVVFGDYNPSGKLPVSFPRSVGQIPIYYSEKNTGRPWTSDMKGQYDGSMYRDIPNTPLYPFGHGLSYTNFTYGDIKLSKDTINTNEKLLVTVNLKNTGKYDGEEVLQLYIRDMVASTTQPVKLLKDFKKVKLKKGESKDIVFTLTTDDLAIWDRNMNFKAEPGDFKIMVGGNSVDLKEKMFYLK